MAEIASLYLILIAIYAFECFVWTHPGDWIFYGRRKGHWKAYCEPNFTIGNNAGITGVGLIPPLPTYILIPSAERSIKNNNITSQTTGEVSFDIKAFKKRFLIFEKESMILRIVGDLIFLIVFLIIPLSIWTGTFLIYWRQILILFLYFVAVGVVNFIIACRRLFRDEMHPWLIKTFLIAVSPLSMIRATNQLSKDLMHNFHPIVVCYHLCSTVDFDRIARMFYYDEARALRVRSNCASSNIKRLSKLENDCNIAKFLKSIDHLDCLLKAPIRDNQLSSSYCPRCHCQYHSGCENCADCEDTQLIPFN